MNGCTPPAPGFATPLSATGNGNESLAERSNAGARVERHVLKVPGDFSTIQAAAEYAAIDGDEDLIAIGPGDYTGAAVVPNLTWGGDGKAVKIGGSDFL